MSSARGRGNGDDDMTDYERQKWELVARNQEKMEVLRLRQLSTGLQQRPEPNKRIKRTHNPSDAAIFNHNLRPRTQRNYVETANEQNNVETTNEQNNVDPDYEVVGDFLRDNEGGQPLGNEYCEVIVNVVMKRDAMLPRPYGEMQTMASALKMNIAWPFNKVRECRKKECKKPSNTPLKSTAGSVGRSLA